MTETMSDAEREARETDRRLEVERFGRLPRWAQREIQDLRAALAREREKLASGPEDSDTFAEPYQLHGGVARPLGRGTLIRFGDLNGRHSFDVQLLRDGGLQVMGYNGYLMVEPKSSNHVVLRVSR